MKKNATLLSAVFALAALVALPRSAAAQYGTDHVTNAQNFLRNEARGALGFIQAGCTLKGVNADAVTRNADGTFKVSVRYAWSGLDNGNDYTDIHYKFDVLGRLNGLEVGDTSAIVFTPYSVADLGIQVLRDALLKDLRRLPADDPIRLALEPLVRSANARTLHLLTLRYRQPR
jgi:hypothetical protein